MPVVEEVIHNLNIWDVVIFVSALIPWKLQAYYTKCKTLEKIHFKSALTLHWLTKGSFLYSAIRWFGYILFIALAAAIGWPLLVIVVFIVLIYIFSVDVGKINAFKYHVETASELLELEDENNIKEIKNFEEQKNINCSEFKKMVKQFQEL